MKTNDGFEIREGNVWVPSDNGLKVRPLKVDMYSGTACGKLWFLKKENCQTHCDKVNNTRRKVKTNQSK